MINVEFAQFLITTISFLLAYFIGVPLVGAFRAWVVTRMGDLTPKSLGFLTLNPVVHVDPFGLIFLLFFHFGWGRYVPINPLNISPPHRYLKLFLSYISRPLGHLLLAIVSTALLVASFGPDILGIAHRMMLYGDMQQITLARFFPASSSLAISVAFILLVMAYLNAVLCILDLIIDGFDLVLLLLAERSSTGHRSYNRSTLVFIPLLLMLAFSGVLRAKVVVPFILYVGKLIAALLSAK